MKTHFALLFAALYISEGWYDNWRRTKKVYSKARAIVLFDRVINQEIR
jgi:hypothetical protein